MPRMGDRSWQFCTNLVAFSRPAQFVVWRSFHRGGELMKVSWIFRSDSGNLLRICLLIASAGLIVSVVLAQGAWVTKTSMPTARWQSAAGFVNGKIIVAGGYNSALGGHLTTVEAYDPVADTWTTKNPRPSIQTSAAYGVVNGILYAAGGADCCVAIGTLTAYN